VTRPRTTRLGILGLTGVVTAFVLSACQVHPGAAAVVGDQEISTQRVDAVAQALCSANRGAAQSGQPASDLPSRGARQGALRVLIDSALAEQFGQAKGVHPDQEQVSAALAQNADGINALPADEQEAFREALKEYAEGQLMVIEAGRQSLAAQGKSSPTDEEALAEGEKLRTAFAKHIEIDVDPRYGTYSNGSLRASSGSLSVPVSARAFDGQSSDPSAAWVAALPAAQKCR
jgi:hypothetical protein